VSESTRYTVLGLVARRPTYGYALVEQLRHWPLSVGLVPPRRSIYKALHVLSEQQLIAPQDSPLDRDPDGPSRRRFAATAEGERRYEEWLRSQPQSFADLCLRIGTARRKDLPALIEMVIAAEHECLARHQELQAPEIEALIAKGASWEAITAALLATIEYTEVAARSKVLRDLRGMLEELRDHDAHEPAAT
jgi:DNA-binding PadR family transcriptional regulator